MLPFLIKIIILEDNMETKIEKVLNYGIRCCVDFTLPLLILASKEVEELTRFYGSKAKEMLADRTGEELKSCGFEELKEFYLKLRSTQSFSFLKQIHDDLKIIDFISQKSHQMSNFIEEMNNLTEEK